jgi:pentose-5-phosphate-3-epimerase
VSNQNSSKLAKCGADVLVAGSYVFNAKNPESNIKLLKDI